MNATEKYNFAHELLDAYVEDFPYLIVVETYYDRFGEDIDEDLADEIHDLITSKELMGP